MSKKVNVEMPEIVWSDRKRWAFLGLPWTFTKYSLTKERLIIQKGLFSISEEETRLYRIMDISLQRSFSQRLFNLGTIRLCSSDKSLGDFELKNVKRAKEVKELLSQSIEEQRTTKRVVNREILSCSEEEDDTEGIDENL